MKPKIPEQSIGVPIEGAMKRVLSQKGNENNNQVQPDIQSPHNSLESTCKKPSLL